MCTNRSDDNRTDTPSDQPAESHHKKTSDDESAAVPAVDMEVLEKLRRELAEVAPGLFEDLINYYVTNTPGLLATLRAALAQGDAVAFSNTAHQLKSNSARLGAVTCHSLGQELELMGRNGALDRAAERLTMLEAEYERVREVFEGLQPATGKPSA